MIISFSGTDGAGKSTQIDILSKYFQSKGKRTRIVWARGGYTPGFELLKRILRKFTSSIPEPGPSKDREHKLDNTFIRFIWLRIAILDLVFLWSIYIRVMEALGVVVICDRYFQDTLLDFRKNFKSSKIEDSLFWKFLVFTIPKPSKSFLLLVPVETSVLRSQEKNEPFPDNEATLSWRLASYKDKNIFSSKDYITVDCEKSVGEISERIQDIFKSKI